MKHHTNLLHYFEKFAIYYNSRPKNLKENSFVKQKKEMVPIEIKYQTLIPYF
ncbi:hypothetical protein DDB_G0293278 [Dictyostelium discoideum AX4]|uniref:Uncharacterized protein DDB_G0293278 n=1 Tax=Dictyostelium discoideum TaxID=44689 RepID=Y5562_DICDI|nr:hypothetical protein DDB_G0293278 [Dictyostelium discoideum AX4]Q54C19.1 RecName: Full=Uncharacterized protein DDB_G0293278 [Dictyostelium discoideum]EAL60838.1 hypothetical protein DDB_G0293278 [Dictyostelium discoideum AX4]|eukprot:XP_629247.1 hypothetical protein DDB_G0293278 [Dictyostelium discoideum AX4]